MRGVVHHLDLTVRDPAQVFAFYDAVLSELGYHLERKGDRGFDWNLESASGVHSIGIVKASSEGAERAHDRTVIAATVAPTAKSQCLCYASPKIERGWGGLATADALDLSPRCADRP